MKKRCCIASALLFAAIGGPESKTLISLNSAVRVTPYLAEDVGSETDENLPSTPTPTPTPPATCKLHALKFAHGSGYKNTSFTVGKINGGQEEIGCFPAMINKILTDARLPANYSGASSVSATGRHYGAGVMTVPLWNALLANSGRDRNIDYQSNKAFISCTGGYGASHAGGHNAGTQIGGGRWGMHSPDPGCRAGTLYLDSDCKLQEIASIDKKAQLCGSIDLYAEIGTPISLVWDKSYKNVPATIVNFKLNPQSSKKTWLWRGSSALPLLVYDPEHAGKITSAGQLFGNWTFRTGELASLGETVAQPTPWKNGYQALATMDKDLDLKVAGEELKDLGLWFDANQDGVSQPGEVKSLAEVGVTSLSYQPDSFEDGGLAATSGYERIVDGKVAVGRSIDWVEKGIEDGFAGSLESLFAAAPGVAAPQLNAVAPAGSSSEVETKGLTGLWVYKLEAPLTGTGYLTFDSSEDGFTGTSISEFGVSGLGGVRSQVLFAGFAGKAKTSETGSTEIEYLVNGNEGVTLKNTAKLSADGTELIGRTSVSGSKVSSTGSYEYGWRATKLVRQ